MPSFQNFFDFAILPIMALYSAYVLWGILGFLILATYIIVSLFYIFAREKKLTEPKEDWKTFNQMSNEETRKVHFELKRDSLVHDRMSAELFIYLYIMPLSILIIAYFYLHIKEGLLYIFIYLLYLAIRNSAEILDESYRIELRLHDEELEHKAKMIDNLEEKLDNLDDFIKRLSAASGYNKKRIREIEDLAYELDRDEEFYKTIENHDDNEEIKVGQDNFFYTVNKDDKWEDIIWKWADAYKISSEIIPRNKVDLINLTSLNLTPYSVNPILSMSGLGHVHKSNESLIDKIPKELFMLKNLIELDFDDTNINNLPIEISNLKNLEILSIVNTKICQLPNEISRLKKLKYLNISGTKIEDTPKELKKIPNLKIFKRG